MKNHNKYYDQIDLVGGEKNKLRKSTKNEEAGGDYATENGLVNY